MLLASSRGLQSLGLCLHLYGGGETEAGQGGACRTMQARREGRWQSGEQSWPQPRARQRLL